MRTKIKKSSGGQFGNVNQNVLAAASISQGGDQFANDAHTAIVSAPKPRRTGQRPRANQIQAAGSSDLGRDQTASDNQSVVVPVPSGAGDPDHVANENRRVAPPDNVSRLCLALQELQAERRACIRLTTAASNAAQAFVRRALGWNPVLPEVESKRIKAAATAAWKRARDGEPELDERIARICRPYLEACRASRIPAESRRSAIEKAMLAAVKQLPGAAWVPTVKGLGLLNYATIIGEAGDIKSYAGPARLRKRMGVAPRECYAMKTNSGETAYAVPRRRRSWLWIAGTCLIKANDNGYREVYDARKTYEKERAPEMTPMHAHRRAQRFMEKRLLRDIWRIWHRQNEGKTNGEAATNQALSCPR